MKTIIILAISFIGLYGKPDIELEDIYNTCAIVESTVETVVNYRDTGTSIEDYLRLVDEKMLELGTAPNVSDKVHWLINYIYDNSDKGVHELEMDIDFICKSELMDGINDY